MLWLVRVLMGVLPVWSVMLVALWNSAGATLDGPGLAQLGALVVHVVLVCGAVLPHARPVGTDRRISAVALGISAGLVVSYMLPAAIHLAMLVFGWPEILRSGLSGEQDSRPQALLAFAWLAAPLSLVACCARDVARDVCVLRGRAFDFRDCGWILLGLLLTNASATVVGAWGVLFVP